MSHADVAPKSVYFSFNSPSSGHKCIIDTPPAIGCEIGDYKPKFAVSTSKLTTGMVDFKS